MDLYNDLLDIQPLLYCLPWFVYSVGWFTIGMFLRHVYTVANEEYEWQRLLAPHADVPLIFHSPYVISFIYVVGECIYLFIEKVPQYASSRIRNAMEPAFIGRTGQVEDSQPEQ
ncbi:hypothetical protein SODALDRAFT_333187 [Sodiomyces alkalinus F11]|uniref:Uncharacterized protein n=1 Tax=Sodiomyces alkalinus (strain CBS 110278 / VKM F-3762 / F11) TaxID=1314773 RepID=A0A3N2PVT1_SODAK|nr:hypothetical protein SODALDRAFT_333187 [Sodiomyces alkalinus F11]ROT38584.1 hypothetical protein SODALDRAFT_333187 [Sodiomyces alkalinus F11]